MSSKLEQKLAEFRITFIAEFDDKLAVLIKLWSEARTSQSHDTIKQYRSAYEFDDRSIKKQS